MFQLSLSSWHLSERLIVQHFLPIASISHYSSKAKCSLRERCCPSTLFCGEAIWSTLCSSPPRVMTCAFIQVNQWKACPCQSKMLRNVHYRDNFLEDRPWVSSPATVPSNLRRICSLQSLVIQAQHPTHSGFLAGGLTMRILYMQPLLTLVWPSVREPVREEEVLLHSKICQKVNKHHQ